MRPRLSLATLLAASLAALPAAGQFVEPDVRIVRELRGAQTADYFGWLTVGLGDITGDGIDDQVVSAIAHDGFTGRLAVFSGADGALVAEQLGAPGSALGYALGAAGDVDGDGIPDYAAGGGQVRVYSGADHGVLLDLGGVTGFADSVDGAGDLDGDGLDDLVVGTQGAAFGGAGTGRIWAFSGADGALLWTRDGSEEGDQLGASVGGLDDLNGDGVPEVVAGAQGAGPSGGGRALVLDGRDGTILRVLRPADEENARVFGLFFASAVGDLDRDGIGEIYVADLAAAVDGVEGTGAAYVYSGRTGFPLHRILGPSPGEGFGLGRAVPDVNGDGLDDLLIGAFSNGRGAPAAGAAYVYSGRSGALLRTITSDVAGDNFGGDAAGTGDVDGDGLPDFLVTAPGAAFLGVDAGRAWVIGGTVLPCPADLDGNRRVNLRDLLLLKGSLGEAGGSADLDGDGTVDLGDVLVLLRDRGRCPAGFPTDGRF